MPSSFSLLASAFSSRYKQKEHFTLSEWSHFFADFDHLLGYPSFPKKPSVIDAVQKAITYQPSFRFAKILAMRYFYSFPYSGHSYHSYLGVRTPSSDLGNLNVSPTSVQAPVVLGSPDENFLGSSLIKKSADKTMPSAVFLYWKEIEASLVCSHIDILSKAWTDSAEGWSKISSVLISIYKDLFSHTIEQDGFAFDFFNAQADCMSDQSRFTMELLLLCVLTHEQPEKSAAQAILKNAIRDAEEIFAITGDLFLSASFEDVFYFLLKAHASQGVLELQVEIERAIGLLYTLAKHKIVSSSNNLGPVIAFIKNQALFEQSLKIESSEQMQSHEIKALEFADIQEELRVLESKMTWIHYGFNRDQYMSSIDFILRKALSSSSEKIAIEHLFQDVYSSSLSHQALLCNVLFKKRVSLNKERGFENFFHYISLQEFHWSSFAQNVLLDGVANVFLESVHEELIEMSPLLFHGLPESKEKRDPFMRSTWRQFFCYMNSGAFARFHGVFLTDSLLSQEVRKGRYPFKSIDQTQQNSLPFVRHLIADFYDETVFAIYTLDKNAFEMYDLLPAIIDRDGLDYLYNVSGHLLDRCYPSWRSDLASIDIPSWWSLYKKIASQRRKEWVEFFVRIPMKNNWAQFHHALIDSAVDNHKSFYVAFLSHGDIDVFCWCIKNNPNPNGVIDLSDHIETVLLQFFSYKKSILYLKHSDLADSIDSDYFPIKNLLGQYVSTKDETTNLDYVRSNNRAWILNKARKNHYMCDWVGMLLPDQKSRHIYVSLLKQSDYETCDLLLDFYEGKSKVFSTLIDHYKNLSRHDSKRAKNIMNIFLDFCHKGLFKKDYIDFYADQGVTPLANMLKALKECDRAFFLEEMSALDRVWNIPDFFHYVYFSDILSCLKDMSHKEQWLRSVLLRYDSPYQNLLKRLFFILDEINQPAITSQVVAVWSAFFQQNRHSHFGHYSLSSGSQHAFCFYQILSLIGKKSSLWSQDFWNERVEHNHLRFVETVLYNPFFILNYQKNKRAFHEILKELTLDMFAEKNEIQVMSFLIKAIQSKATDILLWDLFEIILKTLDTRSTWQTCPTSKLGLVRDLFQIKNEFGTCVHDLYRNDKPLSESDLVFLSQNRFYFLALLTQAYESLKNVGYLMISLLRDTKASEQDIIWLFKAQPAYFLDTLYYDLSLWEVAIDKNYHHLWTLMIEEEYHQWSRQQGKGLFFQIRSETSVGNLDTQFRSHLRRLWNEKGAEKISVIDKLKKSCSAFFKTVMIDYDLYDHRDLKRTQAVF